MKKTRTFIIIHMQSNILYFFRKRLFGSSTLLVLEIFYYFEVILVYRRCRIRAVSRTVRFKQRMSKFLCKVIHEISWSFSPSSVVNSPIHVCHSFCTYTSEGFQPTWIEIVFTPFFSIIVCCFETQIFFSWLSVYPGSLT